MNLIISTVGTSLITNQISGPERSEGWYDKLRDAANVAEGALESEVRDILNALKERAGEVLGSGDVKKIRRSSAELNGLYGLYEEDLKSGARDMHWLIATDTAQGRAAAEVVEAFLRGMGTKISVYIPTGLSTANTEIFESGIKYLIEWCGNTIPEYKDQNYKVYFNLVGSFKSLQGYMNTIGMFYADEILYLFEGTGAELIRIPRLPIRPDERALEDHAVLFALMHKGEMVPLSQVEGVAEMLLDTDESYATLSSWGLLMWDSAKRELLTKSLLAYPGLEYEKTFSREFGHEKESKTKIKLQETLAKVSVLWREGGLKNLRTDGGLLYEDYKSRNGIGHFRLSDESRVSCLPDGSKLVLRHWGRHDAVNDNP